MFGDSPAVKKAKEERKIAKIKNKTEKEKLRNEEKKAKIEARAKHGGVGISFHNPDPLPRCQVKGKTKRSCKKKRR